MPSSKESKAPEVFVNWFEGNYDPGNPEDERKNYERVGYLVGCNGGSFQIHGWGVVSGGGGAFPSGLMQDEALELMQLASFINGASLIDKNIWPYVLDKVEGWIRGEIEKAKEQNSQKETE